MKMKVNGRIFEIVLSFAAPGSVAPWQAEAYDVTADSGALDAWTIQNTVPDLVSSGTTVDEALSAIGIELSEVVSY